MPNMSDLPDNLNWRKAKRSMNNGNCAEIGSVGGAVMVRDTKDRQGAVLRYPAVSWLEFVREARKGRFDGLRLQPLTMANRSRARGCQVSRERARRIRIRSIRSLDLSKEHIFVKNVTAKWGLRIAWKRSLAVHLAAEIPDCRREPK